MDAREVLRTVLATQLQSLADESRSLCISRQLRAANIRFELGGRPARTHPYAWWGFGDLRSGSLELADRLPPLQEARVQASERAAWTAASSHVRQIEPSWLRAPLRFCPAHFAYRHLELTEPVIVGQLAFVSVNFQCALCGVGTLLALRRTSSGWETFASTTQWQS
jgi:hypothetical protein